MTRAELNTFVDTQVTNKTTVNSLTPTNEGNAIKAVADYVDDNKEDLENKSTDVEVDGASDLKYPSVKAVKTYVDANAGIGYLSYVALISQEGTNDPISVILSNNLGATLVFSYSNVGEYIILSSAPIFLENKTIVFATPQGNPGNSQYKLFGGSRFNNSAMGLFTSADGILNLNLEIRVYP